VYERGLFDASDLSWKDLSEAERQRVLELLGALLLQVGGAIAEEGGEEDVGED
jgi:hypothetical protein